MNQNSSSPLVSVPTSVTSSVTISNNYEYFGFKVYIHNLVLNTSVGLRVNVAYLLNGSIEPRSMNDGTYSYVRKYVELSGDDYTNWGNDDTYITTWVTNNFEKVINSTLNLPMQMFRPNEI